jgi:arabinan endo-1,5-alpha-L-arabinosidase
VCKSSSSRSPGPFSNHKLGLFEHKPDAQAKGNTEHKPDAQAKGNTALPSLALQAYIPLLIIAAALSAQAQPQGGPPRDVLFDCPDPAVIQPQERGPVYAFATGYGIPVYRSEDLYHWQRVDRVFSGGMPSWARTAIPGSRGIWAPDIRQFKGRYFLYYAVSTFGSQHSVIGLATNRSLDPAAADYRWEDQGLVLESDRGKSDFNAIDPAMIVDRGQQPYLFWGSYWTGIKAARLDPQSGKLPPGAKIVAVAARAPGVDPPAIEAPYVMEHDGRWYLFVSWDDCCSGERSTYKVIVGRSKSLLGPYLDYHGRPMTAGGGTLVLASYGKWRGPGHNSALHTANGDWLVNAGYDADYLRRGRVLQVRRMYWTEDGWPVVGDVLGGPESLAKRDDPKPNLAGRWTQWIDYAAEAKLVFDADGRVTSGESKGRWKLQGATLAIDWPAAAGSHLKAPLKLVVNGNWYVGRNAVGQVVFGVKDGK